MTDSLRPGILFDVDGTLLDTNYLHTIAWWRAVRDAGHDPVSMTLIHRSVGIASEGLVQRILGEEDENVVEAHSKRYEELRDHVVALPDAAALVKACSERGFVAVLATSGKEKDLEWMLPAIGADDHLAGVTTSSDVEDGKPAPDLLSAAMEQHRLDPERTVIIGDTVWDVEAARRAGIRCIAVTSGGFSRGELIEAGAAEVYDDAADLLARLDDSLVARL